MVSRADARQNVAARAEVAEGLKPRVEDGLRGFVVLHVEPVNRTRSRIDVEIDRHLFPFGFLVIASQIFIDVLCRTEQAFFFTTPEGHANGALRLSPDALQNSQRFHRYRRAVSVVAGASAGVP